MHGPDVFETPWFLGLGNRTANARDRNRVKPLRRTHLFAGRILAYAVCALLALVATPFAFSEQPQPAADAWLGKRVVQKSQDFGLRVENEIVDRRRFILFYKVEQVKALGSG